MKKNSKKKSSKKKNSIKKKKTSRKRTSRKNYVVSPPPKKQVSKKQIMSYERENDSIFLEPKQYRKILRTPSKDLEDNDSVKILLGDSTFDSDDTNVTQMMVFNPQGEAIDEILDGGKRKKMKK